MKQVNLKRVILLGLTVSFLLSFLSIVKADTMTSDETFIINLYTGDTFIFGDLEVGITIDFLVTDGNLTGTGLLAATSSGGSLSLASTQAGVLSVNASTSNFTLYLNNVPFVGGIINFAASSPFVISWIYPHTVISKPDILNVGNFWTYLFNGNFLGFLEAIYVSAFQLPTVLYGILILLITVPIYIRSKSIWLVAVIWILIGGFVAALVPAVAGIAVLTLVLGVASILYKLVKSH